MRDLSDVWFIRLPDGRVVRAKTTKSLRYHISSGRIPVQARVRRSAAEEWTALEWTAEFADIVAPVPIAAAPGQVPPTAAPETVKGGAKGADMKVLGVRGLVDELLNALDSTLARTKLVPAAALGLLVGLGSALYGGLVVGADPPWSGAGVIAIGVCVLLGYCLVTSLITQMTFIELSRLRPARTRELRAGLARHTAQLALAHLLVGGTLFLVLLTLQRLPPWLTSADGLNLPEALLAPVIALRLVWEVAFWPMWASLLLFGPIAVVEECSFPRIIREWWGMVRHHAGRLILYEAVAVVLGLLVAAPFLVPIFLTALSSGGEVGLSAAVRHGTVSLLGGLALTPLLAYLMVANVYIYLNLRYEFAQGK
jgi:hypothetical protein